MNQMLSLLGEVGNLKSKRWSEMGVSDQCLKYDPVIVFNLSLEKFAGTETSEANTGRSWVWSRKNRAKAQRGNQDS